MVAAQHFTEDQVNKYFIWVDASSTKAELVSIYCISKYLLIWVSRCLIKQAIQLLRVQCLNPNSCSFLYFTYSYNEKIAINTLNLLDKIHYEI